MSNKKLKPIIDMPSKDMIDEYLLQPSSDEELEVTPDIQNKIDKLLKFFEETGINYDDIEEASKKKAYPVSDYGQNTLPSHDISKWLAAVKFIKANESKGFGKLNLIKEATKNWKTVEIFDFLNWMKYYQENSHIKYKYAQLWFENNSPAYLLKNKDVEAPEFNQNEERTNIIDQQRKKILARLNSIEKLLQSKDGHIFAGKEFQNLLEALYSLKRMVQLLNKVATSNKTYEDLIIREANILTKKGFHKASDYLYKFAQNIDSPLPESGAPNPPMQGSGVPGGLPSVGPGMPAGVAPGSENESPSASGLSEFIDSLETSNITTQDSLKSEDDLVVEDKDEIDPSLFANAQALNQPSIPAATPKADNKADNKADIEVNEVDSEKPIIVNEDNTDHLSDFNKKFDEALSMISVSDVVTKLEDLAKIFKVRQVPRELNVVDMMLDRLGLASFFPSLSEATNKALESNNYISTRIEDILSKLRGALKTNEIDLKNETPESNSPQAVSIKNKLKVDDEKDKARKEFRKKQNEEEAMQSMKEEPEIEIEEDLAGNPEPVAPTPAPAVPAPKPITPPASVVK